MSYRNFDHRNSSSGSITWILHQLHMNEIDACVIPIAPHFVVIKLKDHSEIIKEFIDWNIKPAGCLFLYDVKTTHNFIGASFRNPTLLEKVKYKIWGHFFIKARLKDLKKSGGQ